MSAWRVSSLGRFVAIEGFDDVPRVWSRHLAELDGRPWFLVIVGDGPPAYDLRELSTGLGLDGRVRWLGWRDPAARFYALADGFVRPSR